MTTIEASDEVLRRRARRESRVRGMLLGLALGDAMAQGPRVGSSGWRGSATTQLACFVTEGLIRAVVRGNTRGLCHPPMVLWHAMARWSETQGMDIPGLAGRYRGGAAEHWPDGWLSTVPWLAEHRGTAPATARALELHHGPDYGSSEPQLVKDDRPPTSNGHHALTRIVSLAAVERPRPSTVNSWAMEFTSYSHSQEETRETVRVGLHLLRRAQRVDDVQALLGGALKECDPDLRAGLRRCENGKEEGPPLSARRGLSTALRIVTRHQAPEEVREALDLSCRSDGREAAAPLVGALLGALHGVERLPRELWTLELGWVVDTLARDLVVQLDESRCGDDWGDAPDPLWCDRYPGW